MEWGVASLADLQRMKEEMDRAWDSLSKQSPFAQERETWQWVEKTVMESQNNLMRKLNVLNVAAVINQALEKGLINLYEALESRFLKRKPEAN
jgi:predicted aconitase